MASQLGDGTGAAANDSRSPAAAKPRRAAWRGLTGPRGGGTLPGMARALGPALRNGLRRRCPACGRGALFAGYLRPVSACSGCGEALGRIRADDFPPYIAILVAGHIVVPLLLFAERNWAPPLWLQALVWPALALALVAVLLPAAKGGVIAAMWALGLTGGERQEEPGAGGPGP